MTIGSNIKQIRKEKKLTQSELAKKINKGLRTVQKYESDDINVPTDVLKDIAKALDVGLVDLLYEGNNAIYVDMCREPLDVTYQKLEILSTDENFEKDMLNDILSKKRRELNLFEQCLLVVYNEQTYDNSIHTEISKFLSSDILHNIYCFLMTSSLVESSTIFLEFSISFKLFFIEIIILRDI